MPKSAGFSLPFPPSSQGAGFFLETLLHPFQVGALAPTSGFTARELARRAGIASAGTILELGAGGGAVTREIVRTMRRDARLIVLERNPGFAAELERRFPRAQVICNCAGHLREYVGRLGRLDSIVSTLPWTALSERRQEDVLAASAKLLGPQGTFVTLLCCGVHLAPQGRRFRGNLSRVFGGVSSAVSWRNVPPVVVLSCRKKG